MNASSKIETFADYCTAAGLSDLPAWAGEVRMGKIPFQHQVGGLNHLALHTRAGEFSEPGCVSADTEYLSPTGWRRIDEYDGGKVMQYDKDSGIASLVTPKAYVKKPCDYFLHLQSRTVDQLLSPEHRVLYQNNLGKKLVTSAEDVATRHNNAKYGWAGRFLTTFSISERAGLPFTDAEIRVLVAAFADGYFPARSQSKQCRVSVVKERKIARMRMLLAEAGIAYSERMYESRPDMISFFFYAPIREKTFDNFWEASPHQLEVIVDEVFHWDGHTSNRKKDGRCFYTTKEKCADFIQYAISATGHRARIRKRPQVGKGTKPVFEVAEVIGSSLTTIRGTGKDYKPITRVPSEDGYKYCFEVDSTFLILRRNKKVFITGNTGKTLPAQGYGLWLTGSGNKVVYTMPPILVPQFLQSLAANYQGIENHVSAAALQGTPKQREKLIESWGENWPDLLMMSYRMFVQYHALLKANGYTCVVVDEATCLKSASSQIHAAVKIFAGKYGPESNGVVLMTGTPVETNVQDAYGLIAILNPNRYGSRRAFDRAHCVYASEIGHQLERDTIVAYKNHNYLHHSLFMAGRRVRKSEVTDLPPRLITEYSVELHPKHKALYRKMVDERMLEIGEQLIDMTTQSALYQAMQRVLLSPEIFTDEKIDNEVFNMLDSLLDSLEGHKVVVYAWFQRSIETIMARYAHLNPVSIYGRTTPAQREANKQKFINDPSCRLWVSNPKSGGVGVDGLQHVSSHTIFAEVCPFPGVTQQAIDRQHRTGQQARSVNVYLLVPTGTIAVKLRNDLLKKDAQQELVVSDKRTILHDLLGEDGLQGSLDNLNYL